MFSVDFCAYFERNDLHWANSKLRYSKHVKKYEPCWLDSIFPVPGQVPDSLIEIGCGKNDRKIHCNIEKTTEMIVDTAIESTESIRITEVVKQGSIFGPRMCCAATAKVNDAGEKVVDYKYEKMHFNIHGWYFSSRGTSESKTRNKEMCKNGSEKENEVQFKKNEV